MPKSLDLIASILVEYKPTSQQIEQMSLYLTLLNEWNARHNLTAILDVQEQIEQHLADSLTLKHLVRGPRVIDVGSGAGLPGIPLAVVLPEIQFTLIDSNQKRIFFLQQVIHRLSLTNVNAVHARMERYQPKQRTDQIVCRAVCTLHNLLQWTQHLHHPDLEILAMKGALSESEIKPVENAIRTILPTHSQQKKCIVVLGSQSGKKIS